MYSAAFPSQETSGGIGNCTLFYQLATGERRGEHQQELGNQVSGAIWLLSVQEGPSQFSVDLSFLIRK